MALEVRVRVREDLLAGADISREIVKHGLAERFYRARPFAALRWVFFMGKKAYGRFWGGEAMVDIFGR